MTAEQMGPVACPDCGERQNEISYPPPNSAAEQAAAEVRCMACGHVFTEAQYRSALAQSRIGAGGTTRA